MAWRTVSRRRRVFSRVVVIVLCLGLLWPQTLPASFAFFQQTNAGPQPQRRWRWPGRKPNLNAERHAPAHVPVQHAPQVLHERSPKAPRGPRGTLRVGDPLPTPGASITPTPRAAGTPSGGVAQNLPRLSHWAWLAAADSYLLGGGQLNATQS